MKLLIFVGIPQTPTRLSIMSSIGGHKLTTIAERFGLKRTGSIPNTIAKLHVYMGEDKNLAKKVSRLRRGYGT